VNTKTPGEDALGGRIGWTTHDLALGRLKAKGQARQAVGHQVHPQDLQRQQWYGHAEERSDEHHEQFADVGGHEVLDELADVVIDDATLFDSSHDSGEVIVEEDHVQRLPWPHRYL